jgi:ATP-dependent DNA ligase
MLARTGPIPVGDGWALEVKFDGMRLQLRGDGRAVCLRSRPGRDCTDEFPEHVPAGRNGAWVKHKHRRTESFLVSGWTPPEQRRPESLLLARIESDGTIEPAGSVPLVLGNGQAADVRRRLESLVPPPTRRG